MADVISIRDKPVTIFQFRDFLDEVDKHMDWDAKKWLEEYFEAQEAELKEEKEALEYEMKGYEGSLEDAHSAMFDAVMICRDLVEDFHEQNQHPRKQDILRPWFHKVKEILKNLNSKL